LLLFAGDIFIGNLNGAQQGCPLGSTLYGLGSLKLIKRILAEFPEIKLSPHFLDDGIYGGKFVSLVGAVRLTTVEGPKIGACMSLSKSFAWWPSQVRPD
jgi:hypothetical protein